MNEIYNVLPVGSVPLPNRHSAAWVVIGNYPAVWNAPIVAMAYNASSSSSSIPDLPNRAKSFGDGMPARDQWRIQLHVGVPKRAQHLDAPFLPVAGLRRSLVLCHAR